MENREFKDICSDILKLSKEFENVNPEIQRIFEVTFVTFLRMTKTVTENVNLPQKEIEKEVFKSLFGDNLFKQNNIDTSNVDMDLANAIMGFNPNAGNDKITKSALSIKQKLNNINKQKIEQKTNEIVEKYKAKRKD
jgi:hypothetical protein